jgi:hypothetical protein
VGRDQVEPTAAGPSSRKPRVNSYGISANPNRGTQP